MLYDAVMVPFDGSDSACAALDEAVRFAKEDAGLALHVVQIVDLERTAVAKLEARGVDLAESVVPMRTAADSSSWAAAVWALCAACWVA